MCYYARSACTCGTRGLSEVSSSLSLPFIFSPFALRVSKTTTSLKKDSVERPRGIAPSAGLKCVTFASQASVPGSVSSDWRRHAKRKGTQVRRYGLTYYPTWLAAWNGWHWRQWLDLAGPVAFCSDEKTHHLRCPRPLLKAVSFANITLERKHQLHKNVKVQWTAALGWLAGWYKTRRLK